MRKEPYVEFDQASHRYFIDGREIPSVTQVLYRAGHINDRWFDEYSRWRGSEVHRLTMIEDRQGKLDLRTVRPELRGYLKAWRNYQRDCTQWTEFELVEHRVISLGLGYAGTLDRAFPLRLSLSPSGAFYERQRVIIDLKTNKQGRVAPWTRLQTAAYAHALEPGAYAHALEPGHWFERHGVCLRPNGRYNVEIYPASDFQRDFEEFYEALSTTKKER